MVVGGIRGRTSRNKQFNEKQHKHEFMSCDCFFPFSYSGSQSYDLLRSSSHDEESKSHNLSIPRFWGVFLSI